MWSVIKWWNRNTNFSPLLQSRLILYFMFFISVMTLFGFAMRGEYVFAAIFIIVGFLTAFFSKNMIVILFLALAVTNIVIGGLSTSRVEEGMKDTDKGEKGETATLEIRENMESLAEDTQSEMPPIKRGKGKKTNSMSEEEATKEIQKLLDLQIKLMTGVNDLQPVMKEVQTTMSNMRNTTFK
jgi:hypothetical protein